MFITREVMINMSCHIKQVRGENKKKQEVPDVENISELIKNRGISQNGDAPKHETKDFQKRGAPKNEDTLKNETKCAQKLNNVISKILRNSKQGLKRDIFLFLKSNYAKNAILLPQRKSITQIIQSLLKSSFYAQVAIGKNTKAR
jgi:hypothetical protein